MKRKLFFTLVCLSITALAQDFKEKKEIDRIEIVEGICQIRQVTKIVKNGVEVARTFHRWAIQPEEDLSQFDGRVKSICKAAWTPDVISKHKERSKPRGVLPIQEKKKNFFGF